jgi:hypothetical protein
LATETYTTEGLIRWFGDRSYRKCGLCNAVNMWHVDGEDGRLPMKLCSWCDLEKGRRFSGVNFPWPV